MSKNQIKLICFISILIPIILLSFEIWRLLSYLFNEGLRGIIAI